MVTLFILVRRDPREDRDQFEVWWRSRHAVLAARMPGLRKYVLHRAEGFEAPIEWDGVAELSFDSADAAKAAFDSPEGREVMRDAVADGRRGARLMVLSEPLQVVLGSES